MNQWNPETLPIEDVSQQHNFISFRIGEKEYKLFCQEDEKKVWSPSYVSHKLSKHPVTCPLCRKANALQCNVLMDNLHELFLYLITFNRIRLLWVSREIAKGARK